MKNGSMGISPKWDCTQVWTQPELTIINVNESFLSWPNINKSFFDEWFQSCMDENICSLWDTEPL